MHLTDKFEYSRTIDVAHTHSEHMSHNYHKDSYALEYIHMAHARSLNCVCHYDKPTYNILISKVNKFVTMHKTVCFRILQFLCFKLICPSLGIYGTLKNNVIQFLG